MSPEQMKAMEAELEKEVSVTFKKKELLVIFNLLTQVTVKYADFVVIEPVIKKIQPIVTVDTNIPQEGLTGVKN